MNDGLPDKFYAFSADGSRYTVIVSRRDIDTTGLSGKSSMLGLPDFRLPDGRDLNKIDDQTFEIVATRERLTRR